MRVLYVGDLGETASSLYRRWAIERLGHAVSDFDTGPYLSAGGWLLSALRFRTLWGPVVNKVNRLLLEQAADERPDIVWIDKGTLFSARTIRSLEGLGCFTVHYNIDNPFGYRNDPGWRLVREALPYYALHLVQRDSNLADYRHAGARDVQMLRTSYEPSIHFPPPDGWSDRDRSFDVVFIGATYDNRPQFMLDLWQKHHTAVLIWGSPLWEKVLPRDARQALWQGSPLWIKDYRETIWRSRICLSFVTHANCDDVAHKSFEITACGGFLLAEDTPGHRQHFAADEEAVFFRSVEECAQKIRRYLLDESARTRIAAAGRQRAVGGGYGNDARLSVVFDYITNRYFTAEGKD
jgi:hypothetical protein